MVYEKLKGLCINAGYEDGHDNLEPIAQVSCGIAAGVVAASVTNPVDVLKTRLQVARANPARWARFEDERENKTVGRMKTSEEVHGASVESLISQEMFPYSSALGAARHLLEHEGAIALMDGVFARVMWLTPRLTLCVFAYERIKKNLS
eukprot:g32680.t1